MIARAIENLFYQSAVNGTHRALVRMGFIGDNETGDRADQVREAIAGSPVAAIEDEPPEPPPDAPATRRKSK